MNVLKRLFFVFAISLALISCEDSKEMTITGTVKGGSEFVVFKYFENGYQPVDTIELDGEKFKIGLDLDTAAFYSLVFDQGRAVIPTYIRPSEKITVTVDLEKQYPTYEISGSPG
jgi:hypothetical protein